jgi:PmbA protein
MAIEKEIIDTSEYLMKKLLSAGADDVVLSAFTSFGQHTKFANNLVVKTGTEEVSSISIFSVWKGRIVETALKEFTKASADEIVRKAAAFAKHLPENENYAGIADGPFKYKSLPYDPKIAALGDIHADVVESAVDSALNLGAKRVSGVLETYDWKSTLLTSHSVNANENGSSVYFSLRVFAEKDASGHKVACSRRLGDVSFEKTAKSAAEIALDAINPVPGPVGKFDLVFEPLPFADLLERMGSAASAFDVDAGLSFFQDKMGKKIGNDAVTLVDDGTMPYGYHSTPFDAEGVPTRRTSIIEKGKLVTYLHNTSTAKRYKTETTGNAGLISPHHWNLVLESGKHSRDELFKEVKNGIYITNIWYTRFQNYVTGDFSTIPRDGIFMIKNGRLEHPVRGIRISSNMLDILKGIEVVGKESENIHSWEVGSSVITPPVLVKNVNITKPTS